MEVEQINITMIDQIGSNKTSFQLVVPALHLTTRELIRLRVHHEFVIAKLEYESAPQMVKEIRKNLNGKPGMQFIWMDSVGKINPEASWETEAEKACQNFQNGRFVIIAAGKQLDALDEQINLDAEGTVEFIRLVPLIGG